MSKFIPRRLRRRTRLTVVGITAGAVLAALIALPANALSTAEAHTYLVLYKPGKSTSDATKVISSAGGALVANYAEIGVVIARSDSSSFATTVRGKSNISGVAMTDRFGVKVGDGVAAGEDTATADVATTTSGDSLSGLQWDMAQINAFAAHAINAGSPSVLVGDVDTGLDFTHPDLAPNYDAANSTDCSSGAPQPLAVGNDRNGHGTHTAGTIAAAANGTGIVGVAPSVKIAGIKSSNDDGFFFPEMVICAYHWVATHGIDVTNNSYFADPWLFNCKNDPEQRALWNAERRAIGFAQSRGTVVVASEGNDSTDLSHPTVDVISPDFPPNAAVERSITNACAVVPVEVPKVIGVTATGNRQLKSFYSSYGISTADVAAPGGDSILQVTPAAPNGRVLSTFSSVGTICLPSRTVIENGAKYCYLQGTSMASPHAAGVAALLLSKGVAPGGVQGAMQNSANPLPCPDTSIYAPFPQNSGQPQACTGGVPHNSFYGAGEVDALKAVS
jgi:subtilisin family serine protease